MVTTWVPLKNHLVPCTDSQPPCHLCAFHTWAAQCLLGLGPGGVCALILPSPAEHSGTDGHREDQGLLPAGGILQPAGWHVSPDPVSWPWRHEAQHCAHGLAPGLEASRQPLLLEELCWCVQPRPLHASHLWPGLRAQFWGPLKALATVTRETCALPSPQPPCPCPSPAPRGYLGTGTHSMRAVPRCPP